jgi:hypothetical protein
VQACLQRLQNHLICVNLKYEATILPILKYLPGEWRLLREKM